MELTVLDIIREEHRTIMDLLQQVNESEGDHKKAVFKDLQNELVRHLWAEEKTVYARLKKEIQTTSAEDIFNDSHGGHHELKEYLQRLNLIDIRTEAWKNMFKDFEAVVIRHCTEEESLLFKEMKEDYSREELIEINTEYQEAGAAF